MSSSLSRKSSKTQPRKSHNSGIALVSVLWLLLLLGGLAATVAYTARVNSLIAHKSLALTRAQAAADAAIVDTINRLSDEMPSRHPSIAGDALAWEFDGIPVSVRTTAEGTRIDVNTSKDETLTAFFQSQGLSAETEESLLKDLRGWRDGQHGNLVALEELRQIPSWRQQRLDCWMESLTVYTGNATVISPPDGNRSLVGEVFRVRATAVGPDEVTATSEWVGRLTGDFLRPALTMRWDHGASPRPLNCGKETSS